MSAIGAKSRSETAEESFQNTSAWKEIEHKLQGLFSNDEFAGRQISSRDQMRIAAAAAGLLLLLLVYLLGRHGGKRRSTILEVHKE